VIRHAEEVMGTVVSFVVRDDGLTDAATRAALQTACATLHDADAVFSTYKPNSPLSRVRRGEIAVGDAPPEVGEVLQLCQTARAMSDGWFDPWAMPGGVDPTGLVKGWAATRALEALRAAGAPAAMVNAAGDIAAFGSPEDTRPWRVAIADPLRAGELAWTAAVHAAMATSGTCERGLHIIDPHTGAPTQEIVSATVIGPHLGLADALATAIVAGGPRALQRVADLEGYDALCLNRHGTWTATERFACEGRLVRRPPDGVEDRHRVEVVAPATDLAIRDREHRDVPVGVGSCGRNDPTL
jgi:thiamine biosynthesis lipoprotein